MNHIDLMQRCLDLAQGGRGLTHPNPMVGCVVLDVNGTIVGEGYHTAYGAPHAEVEALNQAGDQARGGTLIVNLEPCNHTGKTPPCTEKIIAAGIQTVVYGMQDPNPEVAGSGILRLKEANMTVIGPVSESNCQKLNEAFCVAIQTQLPFVILKMALTLDGKIATRNGASQWITSPEARAWVHHLRADSDAILTTASSVIQDNSTLNVRDISDPIRSPVRVVLDRTLKLRNPSLKLFQPAKNAGPIWIITRPQSPEALAAFRHIHKGCEGIEIFEIPETGLGLDLKAVMMLLGQHRLTQVMTEAGGHLAGQLLTQQWIHKLWLLYGNQLFMDTAAKSAFVGPPLNQLADGFSVRLSQSMMLGKTLAVEAYPA